MGIATEMGSNLDTLVNAKRLASLVWQTVADDRVADSVSSRMVRKGLFCFLVKGEEDDLSHEDKGETLLGQKKTTMKWFPLGIFGGPKFCEGHRDVSLPRLPNFGTLGKANMSSGAGGSKIARNVFLSDRQDTSI